jgi:hypothetical protein
MNPALNSLKGFVARHFKVAELLEHHRFLLLDFLLVGVCTPK